MATPGELCNGTAKLLGVGPNVTATAWRVLRDEGRVTIGGRGRSAAHCSPADAANLLIASIGKLPLKSVFKSWQRYSTLKGRVEAEPIDPMETVPTATPELASLKEGHTFSDGMTALLASATAGTLQAFMQERRNSDFRIPSIGFIQVRFMGPFPQACIRIFNQNYQPAVGLILGYSDIPAEMSAIIEWEKKTPPPDESGDLTHTMEITGKTIFTLGELLRSSK